MKNVQDALPLITSRITLAARDTGGTIGIVENVAARGAMIGTAVLERFTAETFAGRIDEIFRIVADETVLEARLISAEEFRTRSGEVPSQPGKRTPFSLVLRAALEPVLPQRIYELRHDEMGSFELFLVPIGPDEHGMCYEAAFS